MDALRVLLLSMLIGSAATTNAPYTEQSFMPVQSLPVTAQQEIIQSAQAAQPTPIIIYVTPSPAPAQTPAPTRKPSGLARNLYLGHKGEDVRHVQQLLSDLGYDVAVGGTFSAKTQEAVMHFQSVNRLTVDGIVGDSTYRKLTSKSALGPGGANIRLTLSYGMKGQDVMELQMRLGLLGYYSDIISGNYLKNTRSAVAWFQEVHGLYANGIAGQQTLYLIFSEYALLAPGKGGNGGATSNPGENPWQKPSPSPKPSRSPKPSPMPSPSLNPSPSPIPSPSPEPSTIPDPAPSLDPNPGPSTNPEDNVNPDQNTNPSPNPSTDPDPDPNPNPTTPGLYMRMLKMGMSGADVGHLQTRLKQLGYFPYTETSFYGEETYWCVYTFQQFNKLHPDGIAGTETLTRLYESDAVPFTSE